MSGPTFRSEGITISLKDVIAGGKESVLASLRHDLARAETDITEWSEEIFSAKERIELWELELARARAKHDALMLAIESAEKAFS